MKSELEGILKELAQYIVYGEQEVIKAYQKEAIKPLDSKTEKIRKTYQEFKKIEQNNYFGILDNQVFYQQAKYLEDFEDDQTIQEENISDYYASDSTYLGFDYKRFRMYFSWRTLVRKGIMEKLNSRFIRIYINELLNQIGCKDEEDVVKKLIEFWKLVRKLNPRIDNTMPTIMKEFYLLNSTKLSFSEIKENYPIQIKTTEIDIDEIQKGIYSHKLFYLNRISSYKIEKSKLLETPYGYLLEGVIEVVFYTLQEEFEKKGLSIQDLLICKSKKEYWWQPLASYSIVQTKEKDKQITIGNETYECIGGNWSRKLYKEQYYYRNTIGYLLKTIECVIRNYIGYRKLKRPSTEELSKDYEEYYYIRKVKQNIEIIKTIELEQIIETTVLNYLKRQRIPYNAMKKKKESHLEWEQEEKIEVVFNQQQFEEIRKKSEQIQKSLILEETQEIQQENQERKKPKEVAKTRIELPILEEPEGFQSLIRQLTLPEKEIINTLLQKQEVKTRINQIAKQQNQMLEVMISTINEKALETIGDTLIDATMEGIYEDYEEELKQVL